MEANKAYERAGHFAAAGFTPAVQWQSWDADAFTRDALVRVELDATIKNLRKLLDLLNEDDEVSFLNVSEFFIELK